MHVAQSRLLDALSSAGEVLVLLDVVEGSTYWSMIFGLDRRTMRVMRVSASRGKGHIMLGLAELPQHIVDEAVSWALDHSRRIPSR